MSNPENTEREIRQRFREDARVTQQLLAREQAAATARRPALLRPVIHAVDGTVSAGGTGGVSDGATAEDLVETESERAPTPRASPSHVGEGPSPTPPGAYDALRLQRELAVLREKLDAKTIAELMAKSQVEHLQQQLLESRPLPPPDPAGPKPPDKPQESTGFSDTTGGGSDSSTKDALRVVTAALEGMSSAMSQLAAAQLSQARTAEQQGELLALLRPSTTAAGPAAPALSAIAEEVTAAVEKAEKDRSWFGTKPVKVPKLGDATMSTPLRKRMQVYATFERDFHAYCAATYSNGVKVAEEICRVGRKLGESYILSSRHGAAQAAITMESLKVEGFTSQDEEWCVRSHWWLNEELPDWAKTDHKSDLTAIRREGATFVGSVAMVGVFFALRKKLGVHGIEEFTSLHRGMENLHSELKNLDGTRWNAHLEEWWGRVLDLRLLDEDGFAVRRLAQGVAEVHKTVLALLSPLEVIRFEEQTDNMSDTLFGLSPTFEDLKTMHTQLSHVCRTHPKILALKASPGGRPVASVATSAMLASQTNANAQAFHAAQALVAENPKGKGKRPQAASPAAKGRGRGGKGKGRGGGGKASGTPNAGSQKGGKRTKSTQPCYAFRDTGTCSWGKDCIFQHGPSPSP